MSRFKILITTTFLTLSICYSQQSFKTSPFGWFSGIEQTCSNRQQTLSFGFTTNVGEVVYKNTPHFGQRVFLPEFEISYNDYYKFAKNNPHEFISYNGLKVFVGEMESKEKEDKLNPEGLRYGIGLTKGFGYDFEFLKIIPFNRSTTTWQQYEIEPISENIDLTGIESKTYSGKHRETGVMLLFDYGLEFDLSYSHTSFSSESAFGKSLVSSALEFGSTRLISYGLQHLFSDSKLFPIIDYIAELGIKALFISLRRDKYFYPFEGEEDFTMSTFNFGIKKSFSINLF